MVDEAIESKRATIDNGTQPPLPALPEADKEVMEDYFDYMRLLLSTLGVNVFEPSVREKKTVEAAIVEFYLAARGAEATGYDTDQGFVVKKGSTAVVNNTRSMPKAALQLKDKLVQKGQLVKDAEKTYTFVEDATFGSTSTAAGVVSGQSMSGPKSWKTKDGKTYGEFTQELLDQVPTADEAFDTAEAEL